MHLDEAQHPTRRRGEELEAAILDAAWKQLLDYGYSGLTFEAVAERAGTSRPVLYRRWPTRAELVHATITHRGKHTVVTIPDTGTLRGDVLAVLREMNANRADYIAMMASSLGEYFADGGLTPRELRAIFIGDRVSTMRLILDRAVERGEADPARLTTRVVNAASDLYRHEVLMTLQPVSDAVLVEIVDEVFLPLVRHTPR
ncbi:MAG: TetR/AcrR family transcriptional regulator [Gordonia sp. (in: high G+C Gram-positive bacteria)]